MDKLVQVDNIWLRNVVRYHRWFSFGNIGLSAMHCWQKQHRLTWFVPIWPDCVIFMVIMLRIAVCVSLAMLFVMHGISRLLERNVICCVNKRVASRKLVKIVCKIIKKGTAVYSALRNDRKSLWICSAFTWFVTTPAVTWWLLIHRKPATRTARWF